MKVGLEKLENHEGIIVKALLDSKATGLFMDTKFAKEKEFKLEKFKKPLLVQNMDGTVNVEGAIIYQVEYNMFFKEIDICNLRKTEMILGMLQLAVYNPEIDQKKGEVKMIWCPLIYEKRKQEIQKKRQMRKIKEEKTVEKLVPKRFQK